ncbi:MAG: hypothetical protein PVJ67_05750 [Candidatus Pacearchaeota archaeon]|jgi:hypothetical protein
MVDIVKKLTGENRKILERVFRKIDKKKGWEKGIQGKYQKWYYGYALNDFKLLQGDLNEDEIDRIFALQIMDIGVNWKWGFSLDSFGEHFINIYDKLVESYEVSVNDYLGLESKREYKEKFKKQEEEIWNKSYEEFLEMARDFSNKRRFS